MLRRKRPIRPWRRRGDWFDRHRRQRIVKQIGNEYSGLSIFLTAQERKVHLPYVFKTRRSIEDSHRFGLPTLARSVVDDADLWPDRIDQHLEGGYLGVFHSSNMEPEIARACMALAVGGASDPVETRFGFHVVRRDHEVEMAAARHILVTHTGSKRPHPDRTKEQALARAREVLEKIRSGVDLAGLVSEYSEDTREEPSGDLGSFPRGVTDPELDEAIFGLQVGEISEVTETQYGFHIFQRYE